MIFNKKEMTEEDIKHQFITPAIEDRGWERSKIAMEKAITDGMINIKGNIVTRNKAKKADYVLYIEKNYPIAIVEAKDNNHAISFGMQQAKEYCTMMDVPFAYSSNGDGFEEYDFLTGKERQLGIDEFPTPDELIARYKAGANNGAGITEKEELIIKQPYYSSQTTYDPRYYQANAVNRTLDAIAKGQDRILLVMATGTGKTYTAFQIVYRLLKAGLKKKILYLADRNVLVDQSIEQDFSPLKDKIHKVNYQTDNPNMITAYQVYFSLYQQISGDEETNENDSDEETVSKISQLFKPDFFDLIIVDECHRGSAKANSNWRKILEYFSSATQIGMTATPKETDSISNIDYFGEPVYTYSLKNGIEDGFLAPFKVINITTDISEGWRPYKGQRDKNGQEIEDRIYTNSDFDYNVVIEDRIEQVASEITKYLKSTDRNQKTIVFCATEEHAERMRIALTNLNSDMCRINPDYVVRITGSDAYGKSKLDYFISIRNEGPVIATTSKLLSTGVDCKMVKLIVLDQMINSMTEFKQIIGRGTRIREKEGKTHFVVMDFRNVTRLFSDPEWDGPIEMNDGYEPQDPFMVNDNPLIYNTDDPRIDDPVTPRSKPIIDKKGCRVEIINKRVSVYDTSGKLLRTESIVDYTKTNVQNEYASLDDFIASWTTKAKKKEIIKLFNDQGIDFEQMKKEEGMEEVDDFDYICHVAYDKKPLTRKERAENVKKTDFLSKYSDNAREVLETLLDTYMNEGIYEIETTQVLKLEPFKKYGTPSKIASYFGGKNAYMNAVHNLQNAIYGGA